MLKKTYSRNTLVAASSFSSSSFSSSIHNTDPLYRLLSTPSLIKEGYLYIRDCATVYMYQNPEVWKKRYVCLVPTFDTKLGPVLFYYSNYDVRIVYTFLYCVIVYAFHYAYICYSWWMITLRRSNYDFY